MKSNTGGTVDSSTPNYYVVDADGKVVSGPWFKDQADRLAARGWGQGYEHYVKEGA